MDEDFQVRRKRFSSGTWTSAAAASSATTSEINLYAADFKKRRDLSYRIVRTFEKHSSTENLDGTRIPHVRLLRKIGESLKASDPIVGFEQFQRSLTERVRKTTMKSGLRKSAVRMERYPKASFCRDVGDFLEDEESPEAVAKFQRRLYRPGERVIRIVDRHLDLIQRLRRSEHYTFVYLTYAVPPSSPYFDPYLYKEVSYHETDGKTYATASTKGITQIFDGEAIFTSLDEWEQNYMIFRRVKEIRTFANYRLWKAFTVWRYGLVWRKYKAHQKVLNKSLYILDEDLREAILALYDRFEHLTVDSFVDLKITENLPFFYFLNDQMIKYEYMRDELHKLRHDSLVLIGPAMMSSLLASGFTVDDSNFARPPPPGSRRRMRSDCMTFRQRAEKRNNCARLSGFLAYADQHIITLHRTLLYWSFRKLVDVFEKHSKMMPSMEILQGDKTDMIIEVERNIDSPQAPMFILALDITPREVCLDPRETIVLQHLSLLISLWEQSVYDYRRYLADDLFHPFTHPTVMGRKIDPVCGDPSDIKKILEEDKIYQGIRNRFYEELKSNFSKVKTYIRRFDNMRKMYSEDILMQESDIRNERDLNVHRKWLERFTKEMAFLNNMVDRQALGLFLLKQSQLKKTMLPVTTNLLNVISYVLPKIGREKLTDMSKVGEDIMSQLSREPQSTKDFVEYLYYLNGCTDVCDKLDEVLAYTKEVYSLMEEFNITTDEDDQKSLSNILLYLETVSGLVRNKLNTMDELTKKFNKRLNKDVESLYERAEEIREEALQSWLIAASTQSALAKSTILGLQERILELQTEAAEFKTYQKAFKVEITRHEILDEIHDEVRLRHMLWDSLDTWTSQLLKWYTCDFEDLDVEEMNQSITRMSKNAIQLDKGLPPNELVPVFKEEVELYKERLPVVQYLKNTNLKTRHWIRIEEVLGRKFDLEDTLTLQMLAEAHCFDHSEELMEISAQASSEAGLEKLLKKVEDAWKELELTVVPHKDSRDVFVLAGIEELQTILDESNININTIAASRHVGPIKPRVIEWQRILELFSRTLDEWYTCQQSWLYLEAIFSAPDIQRQLPKEARMFSVVDKSWKEIMRRTHKMPLALPAVTTEGVLQNLKKNNALLDQITRCLEAYLEVKRIAFPRFYFLSNDELLEILAQTKNPHAVQPHLRKCFDAIAKLEFGQKILEDETDGTIAVPIMTNDIIAMLSPEGERVAFGKGLKARGGVEDWLKKVEEFMFACLRRAMKAAMLDYEKRNRNEWFTLHPNQIVLTVSQLMWARHVHGILESSGNRGALLQDFEVQSNTSLTSMAAIARTDISGLLRKVFCALITVDVHARDTISNMIANDVDNVNDFEWLKMMRYYWRSASETVEARMANAYLPYGYEYLGASGVLVITPLTDRCYLCLMGALQMDLGGAPAGPAGTGKTETTKDLAKALAVQCVVFNCSEGLDYKMMGRFFSGLAQSGAWCCFDEFNRIDIEVLSVIAQQLVTIRNAKAAGASWFMFEGRQIKLVRSCATFITMNPGYAGRTELPDNLKALFRPMAMIVPDYALIAEVILYSEGFEMSKVLARKMVQMYKLCSEQLSIQDHYDFGMRAVKSILVIAGALKRAAPRQAEDITLICALRDSNLPKFLADDSLLFQGILNDLFPGVELPVQKHGMLRQAIVEVLIEKGKLPVDCMVTKIIQLHETMLVRWGVMLVGPTGGGKTTILHGLANTLGLLHERGDREPYSRAVMKYTINPKAIDIAELYGAVDKATLEWRDGLLGLAVRNACACQEEIHQWIINDGPVDAEWIENLNTVLDDNKMLCLANSERIKLTPWVRMIFEVMDLSQASPATVSRCGMVYVDPDDLGWFPFVESWLDKNIPRGSVHTDHYFKILTTLFKDYLTQMFDFVKKRCAYSINQVEISKVTMLCSLLKTLLIGSGITIASAGKAETRTYITQCFIWAALWSVGGNLTLPSREKLELFTKDIFNAHIDSRITNIKNLWDIYMDTETKTFNSWQLLVPEFSYNPQTPFFEILVPTVDTARFGHIAAMLLEARQPIMFTGDTGVGKSVIAKDMLTRLSEYSNAVPSVVNFSAKTSSLQTQQMLELRLEKRMRTVIGAPFGKYIIVFIDDVNMPKLEQYGAQPPIELLRQLLDFGGLYDREKMYWKSVVDVVLSCACAPPGGGRNPLTPRFVRHFAMLLIPPPQQESSKVIFKSILKGFFEDFAPAVRDLTDYLVAAAVHIYWRLKEELMPTPLKSHYVFNLRDLSKCVQGMMQADSAIVRDKTSICRLFYHECLRVFHDRLINDEDKSYFKHLMREACLKFFSNPVIKPGELLLFGDFIRFSCPKENRIYEEITNYEKLKTVLQDYLDDYNVSVGKDMHLILFAEAIEHTLRLARLLRAERGNGLLVGLSGVGKQSLTKLAAHVNGYKCAQIQLTRGYDHYSFHEDLRSFYWKAGAMNEPTVFLFTDNQIAKEEFLEDVNNILNSGEVPNLFEGEEYEKVIIACRAPTKESGVLEPSRNDIFEFFISNVRKNLHLVICMSPVGDAFRNRCRMFPSLVNCCTIDWFVKWPVEALLSVAQRSLNELGDEDEVNKLSETCVSMHKSLEECSERYYEATRRRYYTTPSSYLELLRLYLALLAKRTDHVRGRRDRIATGLRKINETNELIGQMENELKVLEPQLVKKSKMLKELMEILAVEQTESDRVRSVVTQDEAMAKEKAAETTILAADAQRDLDAAMPALEAAQTALNALNKADINELRVFQKPPQLVQFVMEAVCLLLGEKLDWATAKQVLGDTHFLERLQEFDKNNIKEKTLVKLKDYVNHKDFVPDVVIKVSKVAKSMCIWVKAIEIYAKVYKVVEPKRKRVEAAEIELNETMTMLKEKQRQLTEIEAHIQGLQEQLEASLKVQQELEANIELCAARLSRAGRLTSALADEQVRWAESVEILTNELAALPGDILVAAGFVAYLGAFTSRYREEMVQFWVGETRKAGIPSSDKFELTAVLGDPYDIRVWTMHGLPRDVMSRDNAIIVMQATRWPLIIDPQEQANRWIRSMEKDNNLRILKMTDPNILLIMEAAVRTGAPTLIEDVEEFLDPTLAPILSRQVFVQSGHVLIHLGDNDVDYDASFKLYMTSKLPNPHYLPEVCIQVTLINFSVTPDGLEDQLLAEVIRLERPDLDQQSTELIVRINADKRQLQNLEERVLTLLFTSAGCLLDDEVLVDTLNESKETSTVIAARVIEAEATEAKITIEREQYRSLATRGSVLYFVIAQLADVDHMYQFSLKYFKQIFNNVIEASPKFPDLEDRLNYLMDAEIYSIYKNVSRGLFEKHKILFSFLLSITVEKQCGNLSELQWDCLLRGPVGTKAVPGPKPDIPALTDAQWLAAHHLEAAFTSSFDGLVDDVLNDIVVELGDFIQIISIPGGNGEPSTVDWSGCLNPFDKLLLLRALKEEDLISAIGAYVRITLGKQFTENPPVSLHNLFFDINSATPLVFVLSPGYDPLASLQHFAAEKGFGDRLESISLGQGQGPVAQKLVDRARQDGCWVFLQNCHLATSWMPSLETIVRELTLSSSGGTTSTGGAISGTHTDFRLYLSSMPSRSMPIGVLQNSVKVTNEPPKGVRANVGRALEDMSEDYFEDNPLGRSWRAMVFGLILFHAVVLERRKFGPLGWNIAYEFSDSDRDCALRTLYMFCMEAEPLGTIPWVALQYITGSITYGGRVTDAWDQRCLETILENFFSPATVQPDYSYSQSGIYRCPGAYKTLEEFQDFADGFPYVDVPEIFGMHENANITYQTRETKDLLATLVQGRSSTLSQGGSSESADNFVYNKAEEIMDQIPKVIAQNEPFDMLMERDSKGRLPPLTTVLIHEVDRYSKLLVVLHDSLGNLQKAIKGFLVMSEILENLYTAIFNNLVPQIWHSKSYPSLKSLASWLYDLQLRLDFLESWFYCGGPRSFWLSGFFFPQGFMAGVLQTHARKYALPIDDLKFDFCVLPLLIDQQSIYEAHKSRIRDKPDLYGPIPASDEGVLVHGLFVDAARWDMSKMILAEQDPGEMNPPMPAIELVPTTIVELGTRYEAPLYKTSSRAGVLSTTGHSTNFVIAVLLPSNKPQSFWIMQGTALLMQITD